MGFQIYAVGFVMVGLAFTWLFHVYVQRLPVAPTCPSCRAVTRESGARAWAAQIVPALAVTFVGECSRCGWRGRMRWRWATRSARK